MRILVLGGNGFIGSKLSEQLKGEGDEVTTLSRGSQADVRLDLEAPNTIETFLGANHFDAVVNLAGAGLTAGTASIATMERINSNLPTRILNSLVAQGRESTTHLIHAASSTERHPGQTVDESEYSRTKFHGSERLLTAFELAETTHSALPVHLSICRIHNTYGPDQPTGRFIAHVIQQLSTQTPLTLIHPHRVRDFVYVDDTISGLIQLLRANDAAPKQAELGTGHGTTLRAAAIAIADLLEIPSDLIAEAESVHDDPNPVTVATNLHGSLGNCRIGLEEGLERTLREK